MPLLEDNIHVKICGGLVAYDGISQPSTPDNGEGLCWEIKMMFPPNTPDLDVLYQAAQAELAAGELKGVLPPGGCLPINPVDPTKAGFEQFAGWYQVNFKTWRQPQIVDENGARLDPMQYVAMLYNGQRVDIVGHCKTYNNKQKGVACRLDGLAIIASANAPRLDGLGGGSSYDVGAAFGGAPQQAHTAPAQGGAQGGYAAPAQGGAQGGYAAPAQGGVQGGYAAPQQAHTAPAQGGAQGGYAAPQQAHTAPQQGGAQGGYAAPAQGHAAPQQGGAQPGYGAPQHDYLNR
jgi:hypothetical protein